MKDAYKYLIAKNSSEEQKWLPLWVHCEDTYRVMEYLISHWLKNRVFSSGFSFEQVRKTARFLSIFHDYGKTSIAFQAKIIKGIERLQIIHNDIGLCTPSLNESYLKKSKEVPHGKAGEILLLIKKCPASLAAVVGAHHGRPWEDGVNAAEDINDMLEEGIDEIYGNLDEGLCIWGKKPNKKEWIKVQEEFFDWALEGSGLKSLEELTDISDSEAIILTGLVVMADWLASNEEYFPLIPYDNDEPQNMEERLNHAMEKINLPSTWKPMNNKDFFALSKKRFGFYPNSIQSEVAMTVIGCNKPGLFILEAPMGVGKTEAALLAAEEFPESQTKGMMFALPTQATANGIFSRIIEWGNKQSNQEAVSICLAHGMAAMNDEYAALIDKGKHAECKVDDYEDNRLVVHDFFKGSKQALLSDFVVGTIDQILLASLKQKHFMLRHLGLSGKVVIIDECHAYDTYMNEYLERTLQWLGAYNTPVIMLSATLPYERRAALIDAYIGNSKSKKNEQWRRSMGYPLLTWTDDSEVHQKEIEYTGIKRDIKIERINGCSNMQEQISSIVDILSEKLINGGCAAVVANTVNRAQEFAAEIKKALPDKHVLLLHSRFISEDRLEYEKELLVHTGKKSLKNDRDGFIVVGTQVIEQSLDFDVDLMITDLCPMDLLLQRIGRLHRHTVHDVMRPDSLKTPKCYVLGVGDDSDKGSIKVYGAYLLMRTNSFLPENILLPDDIAVLVQSVYDDNCKIKQEIIGYDEARDEYNCNRIKERKDADAFRIFPPGKEKTINRFLEAMPLTDDEQAKAQVRNGDKDIDAIVLFKSGNGITRAPWRYKDLFDASICPTQSECKEISKQRLRFPLYTIDAIKTLDKLTEWEQSVWLRNQYILILDENGKAEVGDFIVTYNKDFGLRIEGRNKG